VRPADVDPGVRRRLLDLPGDPGGAQAPTLNSVMPTDVGVAPMMRSATPSKSRR